MTLLEKKRINHVALVVDGSSSIEEYRLTGPIMDVLDGQVSWLAQLSKDTGDETRVSIYIFAEGTVTCVAFDTDVLRLPSLRGHYRPRGGTPMLSGTLQAITDLEKTARMYGDHAFLVFVLTDGEENTSHRAIPHASPVIMQQKLRSLGAEWTVGVLVPNFQSKIRVQGFGFEAGNVAVWNTNAAGVAEVGEEIKAATSNYFTGRAAGVRGTSTLFANNVTAAQVQASGMKPVDPNDFMIVPVALASTSQLQFVIPKKSITKKNPNGIKHVEIMPFIQETGRTYVAGNAFYELVKSEKYDPQKKVALIHRQTKQVYTGDAAKALIGLTGVSTRVRPQPVHGGEYDIFIQSTSVNRHLPIGTRVLIFK